MKKLFILAMSAMMVMSVSARDVKCAKGGKGCEKARMERMEPGRPDFAKGEREERPQFNKEEFLEMRIKQLAEEMYLDSAQEAAFAKTFREYAKERDKIFEEAMKNQKKLDEKFEKEFGKTLNARQVERVLRPDKPCCHHGMKHAK